MKVVLRQDVPKLGESGTIQTVANGYARNYLIPQGLAVVATDAELKIATHNLAVRDRKFARLEEQQRAYADKLAEQTLTFTAKSGEQGRLYGSITAADIATELSKLVGQEVDRRKVELEEPLRSIGEHKVSVHVVGRLRPTVTVIINGEVEEEEVAESSAEEAVEAAAETEETAEDETTAEA